ncbi:hypothetical protein M5K25_019726 [Dendrobium thyrsiflorum]|uniref:Uncharacterized protein n=1 Tax=Dendrobium thyrsiflorum TaxID=117978 RepID=A0ABD0UFK9_DENTH
MDYIFLNGCKRPDPTRPNMAGSLAAPSTQHATRKAVVAEPPFQQLEDKELSNLSSPNLTNSSTSTLRLKTLQEYRLPKEKRDVSVKAGLQALQLYCNLIQSLKL